MSQRFLTSIDLTKKQILQMVLEKLVTAPSAPVIAQIFYNTTDLTPAIYNGAAWINLDVAKVADGYIPMSKLATNPLERSNHTGTQLSSTISDLAATVKAYRLDEFAAPTADFNFNNKKLTNVATGVSDTDAVNYQQVKDMISGIMARKGAVRVIANSNITLSGLQTIADITVIAGDRVAVISQTNAADNGIYIAATGAWVRASDANTSEEVVTGMQFLVSEGTGYENTTWQLITKDTITLGTTALVFAQTGQATIYNGSSSINIDVNKNISVIAGFGISTTTGVAIDTTVVSQKKVFTIGDGSATSFVLTHNFGTRSFTSEVYESATPFNKVNVDIQHTSTSQATVVFDSTYVPTTGEFTVILVG